jgi:hypothetical protein
MRNLFICGLTGSGKGLLRLLLDGHTNIITSPFGGLGCGLFLEGFSQFLVAKEKRRVWDMIQFKDTDTEKIKIVDNEKVLEIRVAEIIWFLICQGVGFSDYLDLSLKKKIRAGRSREEVIYTPFDSNFFKTLEEFAYRLSRDSEQFDRDRLYKTLVETFLQNWKNVNHKDLKNRSFLTIAPNREDTIVGLSRYAKGSQVIVVLRSVEDRAFTNAKHMHNIASHGTQGKLWDANSLYSPNLLRGYDQYLFSRSFLEEHKRFAHFVFNLRNNENIIVVRFEDLIENKAETMAWLLERLGLKLEPINLTATLNSASMETADYGISDRVYDSAAEILSSQQIGVLRYLGGEQSRIPYADWFLFRVSESSLGKICRKLVRRIQ